jgi:hypothetical protein
VASPAELRKQIEQVKTELKEKFHITGQSRLYNRSLLTFILGVVASVIVAILGWVFIKPAFDRSSQHKESALPGAAQLEMTPAKVKP